MRLCESAIFNLSIGSSSYDAMFDWDLPMTEDFLLIMAVHSVSVPKLSSISNMLLSLCVSSPAKIADGRLIRWVAYRAALGISDPS